MNMANETVHFPGRRLGRAARAGLAATAVWVLLTGVAHAAEEPTLLVSGDAKGTTKSSLAVPTGKKGTETTYRVALRPNQEQGFYLLVKNPSKVERNLSVRLKTGEKFRDVKAVDLKVKQGETSPVDFKAPVAPAPAASGQAAAPSTELEVKSFTFPFSPPAPGQEAKPFTFSFAIELYDKDDDRILEQRRFDVRILSPKAYLQASAPLFKSQGDRRSNEWSVTLACPKEFAGPECPVRLDLSPERIPGLVASRLPGSQLDARLGGPTRQARLSARDIPFLPVTEENGVVSVTADGFPRAFQFRTTFVREGERTPDRVLGESLRVGIPRYLKPDVKPIAVRLEVDNWALDEPVQVDLGVDKSGKGNAFTYTMPFPGVKDQHVWLSLPKSDGLLRLRTTAKDWEIQVPTAELAGACVFQIRVLNDKGKTATPASEAVTRVAILDQRPEGIKFVGLPDKIPDAQAQLPVKATYNGPADYISEVDFYLAAPVEGQIPKGAKAVRARRGEVNGRPVWSAVLDLPRGQKGPVSVSARFVDQVGQDGIEKADVERVAPAAPPPAPNAGTIVGRVVKGTKPLGQSNLPVILRDSKNMAVAEVKTDKNGNYTFENVPPGNYTVFSEDVTDNVRGSQPVSVRKGKPTEAKDIELSRLGR
jgi:hypothetical protein